MTSFFNKSKKFLPAFSIIFQGRTYGTPLLYSIFAHIWGGFQIYFASFEAVGKIAGTVREDVCSAIARVTFMPSSPCFEMKSGFLF